MIYHQRDNKRRKKKMLVTTGVIGSALVLAFGLNAFAPNLLSPIFHTVGRPVLVARETLLGSAETSIDYMRPKSALIQENQTLKDTVTLFNAVKAERDYYKEENARLLRFANSSQYQTSFIPARILSKPGLSPYDTMIIGSGSKEGVRAGAKVLADENTVLGTVSESYAHTALVTLYSSPERETYVLIGPKSIQAVARGIGGGNFEVKVPRNTDIQKDNIVVIASSSPKIVGTIQYISSSPTDTFERVLFKSPIDVAETSYVIVEAQ